MTILDIRQEKDKKYNHWSTKNTRTREQKTKDSFEQSDWKLRQHVYLNTENLSECETRKGHRKKDEKFNDEQRRLILCDK